MGSNVLEDLLQSMLEGEEELAAQVAGKALEHGIGPTQILEVVSKAADVLGAQFAAGECYLPELFAGAEAMGAAVEVVLPAFERSGGKREGVVVIGAVEGDVHDIGKRIVIAMLISGGFRVYDLGVDVKAEDFARKAREFHSDIVAACATLTTTSQRLPQIAQALRAEGLQPKIKYMIGGAAVNRTMVEWAGADGYGENATEAAALARELMSKMRSEAR